MIPSTDPVPARTYDLVVVRWAVVIPGPPGTDGHGPRTRTGAEVVNPDTYEPGPYTAVLRDSLKRRFPAWLSVAISEPETVRREYPTGPAGYGGHSCGDFRL